MSHYTEFESCLFYKTLNISKLIINDLDHFHNYGHIWKVHILKAWFGPPSWKEEEKGILWAGLESQVSVDAGLKQLKVISRGEDGDWEWVPVSGGLRDKGVWKALVRFLSNLTAKGCWAFENCVFLVKRVVSSKALDWAFFLVSPLWCLYFLKTIFTF